MKGLVFKNVELLFDMENINDEFERDPVDAEGVVTRYIE
jgi:hypothetical protein